MIIFCVAAGGVACLLARRVTSRTASVPDWVDQALGAGAMVVVIPLCVVLSLAPRRIGIKVIDRLLSR